MGKANLCEDVGSVVVKSACSLFGSVGSFGESGNFTAAREAFRYDDENGVLYGGVKVGVDKVELGEVVLAESCNGKEYSEL